MKNPIRFPLPLFCFLLADLCNIAHGLDLLDRYPTTLTSGDTSPSHARPWKFTTFDIFQLSEFRLDVARTLKLQTGPADLGIGHCKDGAVWAVLIPQQDGEIIYQSTPENIGHVWFRFHPREINHLFSPETVSTNDRISVMPQMRAIVNAKFTSSWHAGMNAMIPEPKDLTVDVDTIKGPRRFFLVDRETPSVKYISAFENRKMKLPPTITSELAAETFDQLWNAFDQSYAMFTLRPELDWVRVREQFRPQALASKSTYEFADVCANMLKPLRDLHVWLTVAGANVPVFNRPRSANSNPSAHRELLGDLHSEGRVHWAVTEDRIGFIAVYGWDTGPKIPAQFYEALEEMRDTRGLILDVRLNGGGAEPTAQKVAGRFLDSPFVYAYSQYRNGPNHTNLAERSERKVLPRGPWYYDRPVVVLIGQKCMSSNESFISMMTGGREVTTMGDHTCGSSGNPKMIRLPLDMTVSVPRWIDFLPDGTLLDERGVQPQIRFEPKPGAFEGVRDDLLTAALDRLRQLPLPDKPIEGPAFVREEDSGPRNLRRSPEELPDHRAEVKEESQDPSRPKVIAVEPPEDSKDVSPITELRVRFDRPMSPLSLKLDWESGGMLDCDSAQYDPDRYEFTIPVHLAPGALHQVVINKPMAMMKLSQARQNAPLDGFQSPDRHLASLFVWQFRTQNRPRPAQTNRATVVMIHPAPGSQVSDFTHLEIQFDQPMAPPEEAFPYLTMSSPLNNPRMVSKIEYDAEALTFRIPLLFPPTQKVTFTLSGFRNAGGILASPIKLEYQVLEKELTQTEEDRVTTGNPDPILLDLLQTMKDKRSQITSLAERVQTVTLRQDQGLFTKLTARSSSFKWQEPNQYYGDVSEMMGMVSVFRVGCDGQRWWWQSAWAGNARFVMCPAEEMNTFNVSFCDPFGLTHRTPADAATALGLSYAASPQAGLNRGLTVEAWQITRYSRGTPFGSLVQWSIDPHTYRSAEVVEYGQNYISKTRFFYDAVNPSLPLEEFIPPETPDHSFSPPEPLNTNYTSRFVQIHDGSNGRMSVRWGRQGPKGRNSGGLN